MHTFTSDKFPNTHLKVDDTGITMSVTLNISVDLIPFLAPYKVYKKDKLWVYWVAKKLEGTTHAYMSKVHNMLLNNAMRNIRLAKQDKLELETSMIGFRPSIF